MQRPERVMVGLTENIQACLRDFLAGAASMARKRHLASTARGLFCFCLMAQIEGQWVQWVQIRPIRLIRGKTEEPVLRRTALQAEAWWAIYIRGRCPRLLIVVPSRHRSTDEIHVMNPSYPW